MLSLFIVFYSVGEFLGSPMCEFKGNHNFQGLFEIDPSLVSWLIDRYPGHQNAIMFVIMCFTGIPVMFVATSGSIYAYYILWMVAGIGCGSVTVTCNAMCLGIWRGRQVYVCVIVFTDLKFVSWSSGYNGSAYLHTVHFAYSLATTISPLVAAPFLKERNMDCDDLPQTEERLRRYGVETLFPLIGAFALSTGLGSFVLCTSNMIRRGGQGEYNQSFIDKVTVHLQLLL